MHHQESLLASGHATRNLHGDLVVGQRSKQSKRLDPQNIRAGLCTETVEGVSVSFRNIQ